MLCVRVCVAVSVIARHRIQMKNWKDNLTETFSYSE